MITEEIQEEMDKQPTDTSKTAIYEIVKRMYQEMCVEADAEQLQQVEMVNVWMER